MFLCLSCTHCLGRQGFSHLLLQIHFHASSLCHAPQQAGLEELHQWAPAGFRPWEALEGGEGVTERSGCSWPQSVVLVFLLHWWSNSSFPTLWLWLSSSQFDCIRACPFKPRGSSGHSPPSSLWCFTIPSDSLLLAIPPQIAPFLIFLNDHLECTLFCGDPSTMLCYQEWTKRHLNFRSDSLPCSHVPCLVCNQLPFRELPLWEALLLTYISPSSDRVPSSLHQSTGRESMAGLWISALEVPTAPCGLRALSF